MEAGLLEPLEKYPLAHLVEFSNGHSFWRCKSALYAVQEMTDQPLAGHPQHRTHDVQKGHLDMPSPRY